MSGAWGNMLVAEEAPAFNRVNPSSIAGSKHHFWWACNRHTMLALAENGAHLFAAAQLLPACNDKAGAVCQGNKMGVWYNSTPRNKNKRDSWRYSTSRNKQSNTGNWHYFPVSQRYMMLLRHCCPDYKPLASCARLTCPRLA
eukprot:1160428-Pelagomonas_calceolata.AAC.14